MKDIGPCLMILLSITIFILAANVGWKKWNAAVGYKQVAAKCLDNRASESVREAAWRCGVTRQYVELYRR